MTQPNPLHVALEHHLAGRPREAEAICRDVLRVDPDDAIANFLLGVALHQTGRLADAISSMEKAAQLAPSAWDVQNHLSIALRDAGRIDEAIAAARRAVAASSQPPAEAYVNLGISLQIKGDSAAAQSAYESAISVDPQLAPAHNNLGNVLHARGDAIGAERAYRRAAELDPTAASTPNNLASVLRDLERPDEAVEACRTATALDPNFAEAHNNLGNALRERGEVAAALESFRRALAIRPDYVTAHSNYLFALHFDPACDAPAIRAEHERWAASQADPLTDAAPPVEIRDRSLERRLRIGYVSADLREHAVGRFMLPIIAKHDRAQVEVFCYSDARATDALTEIIRGRADQFIESAAMDNASLAARIRADEIDILIDLALHAGRNRLVTFARRAAPVQATYLGYPGTSGMRAMDFRLTDPQLDPDAHSESAYTEKSIRLPHTYWCYIPPPNMPDVAPLPAARAGHVTFGCLNKFTKASDAAVRAWATILSRTGPSSRLLLHAPIGRTRQRVLAIMAEQNIASARVYFIPRQRAIDYLNTYNRIDLALDPFPYNGGTTTCESLLMGVAVVSLAGDCAVRRAGASILPHAGLSELITHTPAEYVDVAARLASDQPRLAELRATLRPRLLASSLCDLSGFVRDLESAYREMWRRTAATS